MKTTFDVKEVNRLRRRADAVSQRVRYPEEPGWRKSKADPMRLLAVFPPLRMKTGHVLRAYQYMHGGNGNGMVWAMPAAAPFPEPADCSSVNLGMILDDVPKPAGAVEPMPLIEGDGTPWSYLCASLLARELLEFGAYWHGSSWGDHRLVGRAPWVEPWPRGGGDAPNTKKDEWKWKEAEPVEWNPAVCTENGKVTVAFFSFTALGVESIYRHRDLYMLGNYVPQQSDAAIAEGSLGYIH